MKYDVEAERFERTPSKRAIRQGRVLLLGALVLGVALPTVVYALAKPKVMYSRRVSEFLKKPMRDTPVRIEGFLVPGSLCRDVAKCEFRFRLADTLPWDGPRDARQELEVHYGNCVVPDTFRDTPGMEVSATVQGELCADCTHLEATQIMAKCPSKYEMNQEWHALPRIPIRSCAASTATRH